MSENDKITEETANDALPAEVETDLAEQETDFMPVEPEEEIAADQRPDYSDTQDGGAGSDEQDGSSLGFWGWLTGLFQRQSA